MASSIYMIRTPRYFRQFIYFRKGLKPPSLPLPLHTMFAAYIFLEGLYTAGRYIHLFTLIEFELRPTYKKLIDPHVWATVRVMQRNNYQIEQSSCSETVFIQ